MNRVRCPVAAAAHLLELAEDAGFVLVLPLPDALDQPLAAQVVPRLLFLLEQPPLDHRLRGDAGVIGAGHPERVEALHPLHADEDVLQRVVERVAEVQRAGHVRRRDDDRERRPRVVGLGVEIAALFPERDTTWLGRRRDRIGWEDRLKSISVAFSSTAEYASALRDKLPECVLRRADAACGRCRRGVTSLPLTSDLCSFVLAQFVLDAVDQRDPAGFDDVFADADGAPVVPSSSWLSMTTRTRGGGAGLGVDDADLVIDQVHARAGSGSGH